MNSKERQKKSNSRRLTLKSLSDSEKPAFYMPAIRSHLFEDKRLSHKMYLLMKSVFCFSRPVCGRSLSALAAGAILLSGCAESLPKQEQPLKTELSQPADLQDQADQESECLESALHMSHLKPEDSPYPYDLYNLYNRLARMSQTQPFENFEVRFETEDYNTLCLQLNGISADIKTGEAFEINCRDMLQSELETVQDKKKLTIRYQPDSAGIYNALTGVYKKEEVLFPKSSLILTIPEELSALEIDAQECRFQIYSADLN